MNDRCAFHDCVINGKPLATFAGASLLDYSIGETPVNPVAFQGINRTSWNLLDNFFGMREIALTVVFSAPDLRTAKLNRSALNAELFGKAELFIPDDGFHYTVACKSTGAEELIGIGQRNAQVKSTYTFIGIRHDDMKTIVLPVGATLYCLSTMPFTDCRLTAYPSAKGVNYQIGGAIFHNVNAGDVIVFDGIDGKITQNGVNAAANVSWIRFPQLVPGENTIQCTDPVTVEYYPTYI